MPYFSNLDAAQVSYVQQQASLEVIESGIVVIASTNLNTAYTNEFNVNRPFIAIIADRSKKIPLIIAKISNPLHIGEIMSFFGNKSAVPQPKAVKI